MPLPAGGPPVMMNVPMQPQARAYTPPKLPVPAAPQPIVRGQAPDEPPPVPAPTPLRVPTPEQVNVAAAPPANTAFDWNNAHVRLDRLGATGFHIDRLADGACCASCLVPSVQSGQRRQFEVRARTADEATLLVLDEAERWVRAK